MAPGTMSELFEDDPESNRSFLGTMACNDISRQDRYSSLTETLERSVLYEWSHIDFGSYQIGRL